MKTLIFSDTHLNNVFDIRTYNFLVRIINDSDRVIINGDFWDSYFISLEDFYSSQWSKLFPVLKAKHTVYIFGNHDPNQGNENIYQLFSDDAVDYFQFKSGTKEFHVEHGHLFSKPIQDRVPFLKTLRLIKKVHSSSEFLMAKFFNNKTLPNIIKSRSLFIKARAKIPKGLFLILGHSHLPYADNEGHNYGTGYIGYNFGSYLVIEDGRVTLHEQTY